ncbi:MAG TPA: fused MFS/spermidine synthase [Hyphomicrobiaceae bacterium]|nr:fused MFS/spermidine synthase [Hyphomicrobiaceae bacterium]
MTEQTTVTTAAAEADTRMEASQGGDRNVVLAFTVTTFLSALLLFSIQPMFAKMVLPVLGGSPSVWAVAMFFFQAALLAGYAYAHFLIARLPIRQTGFVHLGLILIAFVALPIALPTSWGEPPAGEPYLWQIGLFSVAVGLPFLAVSANAPLLQAWFASTGHRDSSNPYFLYAASNLGSLIALLGYPFLLEPLFGVSALSRYWTGGFVLLAVCIAGLFWMVRTREAAVASSGLKTVASTSGGQVTAEPASPTWSDRLGWIGLALVPSALLTAFTTHITTDVASAPLLWVLPLSIYLLTFVLVFRDKPFLPDEFMLVMHRASVLVALLIMSQTKKDGLFVTAPIGFLVFFVSAMVAHRTLYLNRPAARHLTEFYLWMSLGGALGGLSAALIAPKLFSEIFEYPLLLAFTMACRPGALTIFDPSRYSARAKDISFKNEALVLWLMMAAGLLMIYWLPWAMARAPRVDGIWSAIDGATGLKYALLYPFDQLRSFYGWLLTWGPAPILAALAAIALLANSRHPPRQFLAAGLMCLAVTTLPSQVKRGEATRSYFGVYRVQNTADGEFNTLLHGTTLHGAQRVRDSDGNAVADISPLTYYNVNGPMGRSITARREALKAQGKKGRYGVIGLGAGSLACFSEPGESWRFFEIDPVIVNIASDGNYFTFIQNCQPKLDVVIGDARLTIAKEQPGSFDLLIVDAFSSDAVPVHLMTAEALKLYQSKLTPDGVLVLHISNRYLDLDSVLASTVQQVPGLTGFVVSDDDADGSYEHSSSTVAIFGRTPEAIEAYRKIGTEGEFDPAKVRAWTDDYSDIIAPFISKYRKRFGGG